MQLYILDKDPVKSAQLIPDKYKFKMLIELGQLICSAGLSDVYKPIAQGKELQQWVKENIAWTYHYFMTLMTWSISNINMKGDTLAKLVKISNDVYDNWDTNWWNITKAYFRYAQAYQCAIPSKTLLPIEICIEAYKEYLQWKMKGKQNGRT
jgi:hypothetical protein